MPPALGTRVCIVWLETRPSQRAGRAALFRISGCMSLNELINKPDKFQSSQPYLVVQHVDWVTTRYLFINGSPRDLEAEMQAEGGERGPVEDETRKHIVARLLKEQSRHSGVVHTDEPSV